MFKRTFLISIAVIILLTIAGCKGTRTVKVVVANQGIWYSEVKIDSGTTTRSGYYTESYNLGKYEGTIEVDAWRITSNAYSLEDLTISIVEHYDNGFLYTASDVTKATITNSYVSSPWCTVAPVTVLDSTNYRLNNPLAIATVTYDFSAK